VPRFNITFTDPVPRNGTVQGRISIDDFTTWPLYREGDRVHVQNTLVFLDQLPEPFDPAQPWRSTAPREVISDDGKPISEWTTSVGALGGF
jgi:CdiI N-terminal domain